ncbi:gamma-glutamyltransferase family protein [Aestuariispira ectoiniformans]|uniref:gamma-glutamyltransferase family protein n=1 Tax=Aestuariispira ectoiniformans TaxID=2775080 RepID=UPI00223B80E7|nr:gamma-glutamyltransferase family protein [Aestuariispira ectoiniformans]
MFTTRPELRGTFGMAASTHWLASQVAMRLLERDGNAFDAATAAGLMLQVCEPHMNGPAGDVPLIIHDAKTGKNRVVCGQGPLPEKATIDAYRALGLEIVPGTGLLAAVVPGAFDAWMLMFRDYGSLSLRDVMEPAIHYAEEGCPIPAGAVDILRAAERLLTEHWPANAAIYMPDGTLPEPQSLYKNPALAETWRRLLEIGEAAGADRKAQVDAARDAWSRGFVAEEIDRFCREEPHFDVTGQKNTGFLTADDMGKWSASYEDPVSMDYHGHTVLKCGPWSQGPVQLQSLALLKDAGLEKMDPRGADFIHTIVEAMKLSYADREAFYGDPDFIDVPLDVLLSEEYNAERRKLIGEEASMEFRPGTVEGFGGVVDYDGAVARRLPADQLDGFGGGEPTAGPGAGPKLHVGDTCHLDVIDRWGNMVSATPSGGWLQSSPVIPKLGFPLGTRAQMAWLDEGTAASLVPGKRPRTTLTPSLALKDGKAYMPYGTPGGDQQDQWQLIFLLRHIHHGMNLQEAIDCPSFHIEHFPGSFYPRQASPGRLVMEGRFDAEVIAELKRRGHDVAVGADWSEGRMSAASWTDGVMRAAANPRGMQGYAVGR